MRDFPHDCGMVDTYGIVTFSSASLKEDTTTASCLVTREATEEWEGQSGEGGDGMGSVVSILRACRNW